MIQFSLDLLTFWGIDSSLVSIVKCRILYQMLKNQADASSILQVWFSSAWTSKAQLDFQNTVTNLMESYEIETDVLKLLSYWKNSKIDDKAATQSWSRTYLRDVLTYPFEACTNLRNEHDRVDYARYLFTGVIFADEAKIKHGNVTMFSIPDSFIVTKVEDENFYHTFNFNHSEFEYEGSLMKSMEAFMIKKTKGLASLVSNGRVRMNFMTARVGMKTESMKLFDRIKENNVRTIDWSNLCDYFSIQDFLKMAKAASSTNTVHYFHVMNWAQCYKGSSIFDYKRKMSLIKAAFKSYKLCHKDQISKSENYRKMWADELKFMNNVSVLDWSLTNECGDKYLNHFFGGKDVRFTRNIPIVEHWGFWRTAHVLSGKFAFV